MWPVQASSAAALAAEGSDGRFCRGSWYCETGVPGSRRFLLLFSFFLCSPHPYVFGDSTGTGLHRAMLVCFSCSPESLDSTSSGPLPHVGFWRWVWAPGHRLPFSHTAWRSPNWWPPRYGEPPVPPASGPHLHLCAVPAIPITYSLIDVHSYCMLRGFLKEHLVIIEKYYEM